MPEQVKHWVKTMDIADPELKELLEKQITSVAYKTLGDFRKEILLSLPPKSKSKGLFNLGEVVYKNKKWPFGISKKELMQNLAIFGRSGAGKTNVAFHIMEQLTRHKVPFLFLDWKRTARHLLPNLQKKVMLYTVGRNVSQFQFNPFITPPGQEENVYINQIVDCLADAYTLGDGSRSVLQKAIKACYENNNKSPTVKDIIQEINDMSDKNRVGNWKISALRALESLDFANITSTDKRSQQELARSLLNQNTIIELDSLSQGAKKFIVPVLCLWLYSARLRRADREQLKYVIFIEEAHHVLYRQKQRANEALLEMLFRQCREIGLGIIALDQHPHLISSAVLGNTYTSICLNQKDPSDINKAAALSLVDTDDKHYFSMLPVGQGIVKLQDRWFQPILIQFPLVQIHKGKVTDEAISRYFSENTPGSVRSEPEVPNLEGFGRVRFKDIALNERMLAFMEDIALCPDGGVKERYKRLGLSVWQGNRIKEELIYNGWVEGQMIKVGQTRKLILRLTNECTNSLGRDNTALDYGSILHEYWKRYYGRRFKEQGYEIDFEVARISGRVDLVATKDKEVTAIEIETGKSNAVNNVRQDLLSGYGRVMVTATDEKALQRIETQLAQAGLIIPGRVELVRAGEGVA